MIFQEAIQTAGNKSYSDIIGYAIQTRATKGSINLSWSYNRVGDLDVATTLKPAGIVALPANPANTYRSGTGLVQNNLAYMTSYNRLSMDFGSIVRTVPLTVATQGLSQLISINPATTTNKLMRVVARTSATAGTVRIYVTNSTGIYKQIDITLPVANTEYLIDDIDWMTNATYGVVNVPVLVDGINKATAQAVVTTVGTLPAGGTYNAITVVGTGGAEIIETDFYNNEWQKYGAKIPVKFCCFVDALPKIEKELQDLICRDKITSSYTKSKKGTFSIKAQKWSSMTYALLQGSDVFEQAVSIRTRTEKIKAILNGANVVVPISGQISDVSINCQALIQTVNNLTSAQLALPVTQMNWSLNTTTNQITLPSSVAVGTEIELAYVETKIGVRSDLMQVSTDLPFVFYYTVKSADGKYLKQYELVTTSCTVTDSLGDDSDTIELEFTLSAEENQNFVTQVKI